MATNSSNIGSYKNTAYKGNKPCWPRPSQIRRGSYTSWHSKSKKSKNSR